MKLTCLFALLLSATVAFAAPNAEYVPGEYVIKLKKQQGMSTLTARALSQTLGVQVKEFLTAQKEFVVVKSEQPMSAVLNSLNSNAAVAYAEPNYIYRIVGAPNDEKYGELWGMNNTGQAIKGTAGVAGIDISAEKAWAITTGSKDVVVAVIDTGVNRKDPDLVENTWTNEAELNGKEGVDDDKNGYVDDIYGYDFANKDADPMDDHGHGTHCSGTIGAKGNDGVGVAGVAWNVKIMGLKFLTAQGSGSLDAAVKAIDYATKMGAHIMSNSWGGGPESKALFDIIAKSNEKNVLFVAAAGNDGKNNDISPTYPGSYKVANVLAVAALDNRGQRASFSSYGVKSVHVGAPGVNVLSTTLKGLEMYSGTSMATPHVSGIAALLKADKPNITALQMKEAIIKTSKPLPSLRGKIASGMADAYNALTNTMPPPDPNDPSNWDKVPYAAASPNPYPNNANIEMVVKIEGAKRFALHFAKFATEAGYDFLTIYDMAGNQLQKLSGNHTDTFTEVFTGDTVVLKFTSDSEINFAGFEIDQAAVQK